MGKGQAVRTAVFVSVCALAAVALTPMTAQATKDPTPGPVSTTSPDPYGLSGLSTETISYGTRRRQDMDIWWTSTAPSVPASS